MGVFDEAKRKMKNKAFKGLVNATNKRGVAVGGITVEGILLSDALVVLGDLQKTHILVDREKLQKLIEKLEVEATIHSMRDNVKGKLVLSGYVNCLKELLAEKLLEPTK